MNRGDIARFISFILTVLTLINIFPFSVYAEWRKIELSPGRAEWKYYDNSGHYRTGDFIDSDGNIYFFESDGTMVSDYRGSYLRYYGKDGALKNYGDDPDGTKRIISEKYLAGEEIRFSHYDEMCEWWRYFNQYYNDYDMFEIEPCVKDGPEYIVLRFDGLLADYYRIPPTTPVSVRSELVQNTVRELASRVTGATIEEKVSSACKIVADFIDYDYEQLEVWDKQKIWMPYGLERVINNKKGVCRAYAILTARILREAGIEAEIVSGVITRNNGETDETGHHAWIRVNVNQGTGEKVKWMFADPTWYDTCEDAEEKDYYLNMTYADYMWSHRMEGYWTNESHRCLVY